LARLFTAPVQIRFVSRVAINGEMQNGWERTFRFFGSFGSRDYQVVVEQDSRLSRER